jgi:flagellar protein FliO/FliZ
MLGKVMKLSIRLSVGTHTKTFSFSSEKIFLVIFSVAIAIFLSMDKANAEVPVESGSAVSLNAPAVENSAAVVAQPDATLAPALNTKPNSNSINSTVTKPTLADAKKISSGSQLANLMGGLILILGLIYGLSWFVKRFSQGGFTQNSTIKMLSAMPLGTRERIMLVDVGGKQILLGITATTINTLHVFDDPVINTTENIKPATSDFSQKLMALLQKNTTQI